MDLDNAVKLVELVCSGFRGTLQDHGNIQNAVKIIKAVLKATEDEKAAKKKPTEDKKTE